MNEFDHKKGNDMFINPTLKAAALATINDKEVGNDPIEISGYPGMYVAKSGCDTLSQMYFFVHDKVRYCIGPKKK